MKKIKICFEKYLPSAFILAVSLLIIYSCIKFFIQETNYSYYSSLFSYMPSYLIFIRFLYSILVRVILVILAVGLVFRIDICRKLIILYAFYTIITVAFKHPYNSFVNIFSYMIRVGITPPEMYSQVPILIYFTYIITCIKTVCIWFVIAYILTKKQIKEKFSKAMKND